MVTHRTSADDHEQTGRHARRVGQSAHDRRGRSGRSGRSGRPAGGEAGTGRILEIDGLRGLAIALIVVYHVWLNRVSGGVDVFLLLSGFFITGMLLRHVERHGRVRFTTFYARIVGRIFPPALVVLVAVVVATVLFLPLTRWRDIISDVAASALYVVNWHLATNAVDYLASQNAASPVQHYWSLAVQAQFYLVWPVVVTLAVLIVTLARVAVTRVRPVLAVLLGTVFVFSFAYSVQRTAADQVFTYFDTLARLWEFALGGLLLLTLPYLRLSRSVAVVAGWLGLVALVVCGMVFRGGDEFPGWAALWPTLAAALLIVTAATGSTVGADRLLRTRPLRWLGNLSYALYLWHWPVLICYLAVTERTTPSLRGGLLVIGASVVLAIASRWLLEIRLPRTGLGQLGGGRRAGKTLEKMGGERRVGKRLGQGTSAGAFALGAAGVALVLATTATWHGYVSWQQSREEPTEDRTYPGAAYLAYGGELPDAPYRPGALAAKGDRAVVYDNGCHQEYERSDVVACEFGDSDGQRTVALVGGSHSAHWLPAFQELADEHGWRIVSVTKSGCRFSAVDPDENQHPSCIEWNDNVLTELARLRPDLVFTTATVVTQGPERTPEGYLAQWRRLELMGLPVIAVRDTPRPLFDVPECVERHGPHAPSCGRPRDLYALDQPPAIATRPDLPANVDILDLTDYVCTPQYCPAVVGNVLVYHDDSHLSATYARTLAPLLGAEIIDLAGW